jgi:putative endopeptidase
MAQSTPPAAPATTGWGVDISARDLSVKPGDDFDAYANGTGRRPTPSPPTAPRPAPSTI